jgi:hypothetical protein
MKSPYYSMRTVHYHQNKTGATERGATATTLEK